MSELESVRGLLGDARRRLAEIERQADALRIEVRAYERVIAVMTGGTLAPPDPHRLTTPAGRRRRGLSHTWREIFAWIGRQASPPDTEAIWQYVEHAHPQVNRNTLRSQLSVYTDKRLLIRDDGRYSLSSTGIEMTSDPDSMAEGSDLSEPEADPDEATAPRLEAAA